MTAAHVVSAGPRGPAPAADAPASVEPRRRRTRARPTRGLRPLEGSPEYLGSVPLVAVATWVLGVVVGYIVGVRRGRKQRDNASTSRYAHASTRTLHLDFPNPAAPRRVLTRHLPPDPSGEANPSAKTAAAATSPPIRRRAAASIKSPDARRTLPLSPLPRIGDHSAGTPLRSPVKYAVTKTSPSAPPRRTARRTILGTKKTPRLPRNGPS